MRTKYWVIWLIAHANYPITGKAGCIWDKMELEEEWSQYALNPFSNTL